MLGKKLATRGNKQESITDPLLTPFICNPVPNSNNFHPDENSSSSSKDLNTPDAKRYASFSIKVCSGVNFAKHEKN